MGGQCSWLGLRLDVKCLFTCSPNALRRPLCCLPGGLKQHLHAHSTCVHASGARCMVYVAVWSSHLASGPAELMVEMHSLVHCC